METKHFGALYEAYFEKIYRFLYYRTLHKETAEDLTSKTFLKALEHIDSFDSKKGQFSTWLFRIARNTLIDHFRTNVPNIDIEEAWSIGEHDETEKRIDEKTQTEKIQKELRMLPKEQEDIVKMRKWDELSYKEIGEILGKSEGACKMAFSRAIQTLRDNSHYEN